MLGSEARQDIALAGVCVRQTQLLTRWYQEVKRKKWLKTSYIDNLLPSTSHLLLTAPSATNSIDSFTDDLTFGIKFPSNALPTEPVEEISCSYHSNSYDRVSKRHPRNCRKWNLGRCRVFESKQSTMVIPLFQAKINKNTHFPFFEKQEMALEGPFHNKGLSR